MKHSSSEAVSSSPSQSAVSCVSTEQSPPAISSTSSSSSIPTEDLELGSTSDGSGGAQDAVEVDLRGEFSAVCRWTVHNFPRVKAAELRSKCFEVGGYEFQLLVHPGGDSQALPGCISVYLQIMDPHGSSSPKWECFASYQLAIVNVADDSKTIYRDSSHRFSSKKKSHGWCDFTPSSTVFDSKSGYLSSNDSVLITADILILEEFVSFICDNNESQSASSNVIWSSVVADPVSDVLSGEFTWKVHNFSLFKDVIKTQKITSPVFPAGDCNLRISVYRSSVNGHDYLSMCLESKDTEKISSDRSWCLFRMSVLNYKPGSNHSHRDSYGRFAADNKTGDDTSLGWNDYMKMVDFVGPNSGFLVDDTALFSTSFHVIKEFSDFSNSENGRSIGGRSGGGMRKPDGHMGKFTWRIENFERLKDLLEKRKITGLYIKSKRFQIGNRDCRLIVYPRGQSQPPCHLAVSLEVTDSQNTSSDWSCFVSHRLSVVNQKMEEKSVSKESQNRYSKSAKDWGWPEFVTLTSLFDQDSGFLVQDTVKFSADVLILKETSMLEEFTDQDIDVSSTGNQIDKAGKRISFTWKVENFSSFKEIMETRKIFSKFFQAVGCELRIGVYESVDTICIYLESDQSVCGDPDKNFWVRYGMAVVNQKNPAKTVWKESSICTKTGYNSLKFMKVSDMLEADAGFLVCDTVVFVCEILDCSPWFEFSDLEVLASDDDQDADIFRKLLCRVGFHLTYGDNPSQPQVPLREKVLMDADTITGFLTGLRVYLDDPAKLKRLLLPTKLGGNDGKKAAKGDESSPSLMNLLMGVKVFQQAIVDLLLDKMDECCQPSEGSSSVNSSDVNSKPSADRSGAASQLESDWESGAAASAEFPVYERLDSSVDGRSNASAVQSSDANGIDSHGKALPGMPTHPPVTMAGVFSENPSLRSKTKWPEQSEELLGLIVNSLRALDGAVPQGCPEPRQGARSAQKIFLVLEKAPKHLQPDLVALVPKLVEHSQHPLAARALLERLKKSDAEPDMWISVFGALSQLECDSNEREHILSQSFQLLADSNSQPLAATIDFIFKAASKCQRLPEAVRSVRVRLKSLGAEVSPCVLDSLSKTVNSSGDVTGSILRDIECDGDLGDDTNPTHPASHFSDTFILIEMLSIPCLAEEASKKFERVVARGTITAETVGMVLQRRLSQRLNLSNRFIYEKFQHPDGGLTEGEAAEQLRIQQDDFNVVHRLAKRLSDSSDPIVKGFVKLLYSILFMLYDDESSRGTMLKRLVDRSTSTDSSRDVDLDLNIDREALSHQLCASQDDIIPLSEERKADISNMAQDKAVLAQKLSDSEAANSQLQSEMRAEKDRFAWEKKKLDEEIEKHKNQKKRIQGLLSDAKTQLKSSNRDKLEAQIQKLTNEKTVLLHQLSESKSKNREKLEEQEENRTNENKKLQDDLHNAETEISQLKLRLSSSTRSSEKSEAQVRQLTRTLRQTEQELGVKEANIGELKSQLQVCQKSLAEEMYTHVPPYGYGLHNLSMGELDTVQKIHAIGLMEIHDIKQSRRGY